MTIGSAGSIEWIWTYQEPEDDESEPEEELESEIALTISTVNSAQYAVEAAVSNTMTSRWYVIEAAYSLGGEYSSGNVDAILVEDDGNLVRAKGETHGGGILLRALVDPAAASEMFFRGRMLDEDEEP